MDYSKRIGRYLKSSIIAGEYYEAYIPNKLPPQPPINIEKISSALELANISLGRLDGVASLITDIDTFLYMYIRKEAVLSSQIEGTESSLSDILSFENEQIPGAPIYDVEEVICYVSADKSAGRGGSCMPSCVCIKSELL